MKLRNSVNGNVPFEGDRVFRWTTIPANAKILSATAVVTPVDTGLNDAFTESLLFSPSAPNFGATKQVQIKASPAPSAWVEVDFHGRRTLVTAVGTFDETRIQVDVGGGTYVEINRFGAFKTPSDTTADDLFIITGSPAPLPGLTVAKLKLTNTNAIPPGLTSVTIRSVPTNVSLRVGELAPFWTRIGELITPETTTDFSEVLQAALTTAKVENGFYDLPITVHTDTIARLKIELEIEFLTQQEVLPAAVPEVALPFDASTQAKSKTAELTIEVPSNSRVIPSATSAHVRGAFSETRIALGPPIGPDHPDGAIEISPTYSPAQVVVINEEIAAVAIDLLLEALTPSARLQLDIRGDFDSKPDEIPLLPAPVDFTIEQQPQKGAAWTTVKLPSEFLFAKGEKTTRYWILLQSVAGRAAWSFAETKPGSTDATTQSDEVQLNMQATVNGGMSWQDAIVLAGTALDATKNLNPPFVSFFRLRNIPKTFKMPIKLLIGPDEVPEDQVLKSLDRFEPLGRVDFTLDTELADGINEYLQKSGDGNVAGAEHVTNPGFEQWQRVGEQMISKPPLELNVNPDDIAFSPDGKRLYVLDQGKAGAVLSVDVDCNQLKEEKIDLALNDPRAFVVSPDGRHAYVTDGFSIEIVNLDGNHVIGAPVQVLESDNFAFRARHLVLSADGQRLYIVGLHATTLKTNRVRIVDTAKLEEVAVGKTITSFQQSKNVAANLLQMNSPGKIALSPDESFLYLLVDRGTSGNSELEFVETSGFTVTEPSVAVGVEANDLALTPDGKTAVVANSQANNISIIDTATRTAVTVDVQPNTQPMLVTVTPDGTRSYVFSQGTRTLTIIDNLRHIVLQKFPLAEPAPPPAPLAIALALSPQGNELYIANRTSETLSLVQFGLRQPSEWQLTSGDVNPLCLPEPFHLVAQLGSITAPTALSQVVPVVPSSPYELSFWGIATESITDDVAKAEVLWLSRNCGLLQSDSIPIQIEQPVAPSILSAGSNPPNTLMFHRLNTRIVDGASVPLTSPAGADQAEIRFSAGRDQLAVVDVVSFAVGSELAANSDFKSQTDGQLDAWTVVPPKPAGFSVIVGKDGIQMANAGAGTIELIQEITPDAKKQFVLEFQGKLVVSSGSENPRIEVRWLRSDGSAAAEPKVLQILPQGLDSATAIGTVPENSVAAEIHFVIPTKTTIEVSRVSLRYLRTTPVPVKFVSEAPGDLTVSGVRIAFEEVPAQAPPIPPTGLCTSTAPGCEPGEKPGHSYCHHCGEETEMVETEHTLTAMGRPAMKGRCSTCKSGVMSIGGPLVGHHGEALPLRQTIGSSVRLVRTATVTHPSVVSSATATLQLTDVRGIGEARAKQLVAIGIDSVEGLAASTPETVAKIRFITPQMASRLVAEAKSLLLAHQ